MSEPDRAPGQDVSRWDLPAVEGAQKEILLAARKLADDGTIQLGGKGEEYV